MASPTHLDPHSGMDIDPPRQSSDSLPLSTQTEILISVVEPSSFSAATTLPMPSSSSSSPSSTSPVSASASAWRKLPAPVPKLLPDDDNSSVGPLHSPVPSALTEGRMPLQDKLSPPAAAVGVSPPSSSASIPLLPRKIPPVPKFSPTNNHSSMMGPPPAKSSPSSSSRGVMGPPPPVPKFQSSSSGEKNAALGVPPKVPPTSNSQPSSDEPSESVQKLPSKEEITEAAAVLPVVEGGGDAAVVTQGNGVSAVEGTHLLSLIEEEQKREVHSVGTASSGQPPYVKPSWSADPGQPYSMEILKSGNILGVEDVSKKGAYMFGRSDRCDFVLEHPTVSRYHAVLQYNSKGESFIYDLGSTHGTFINKLQVKGREYVPLHVGDIVRFGYSSRLHAFQGPLDLMPEEGLSKKDRQARRLIEAVQDRAIREASLIRGKRDSMASDGISWGMQEDAEEEAEEDVEEVTWQTFKGELTERQQKTLGKIHKYNEKLSNLRKENDAIQAKEISQGGLTQGQQTQVARNDQRMAQLVEEVDNLEETLNESIQESISGRTGIKRRGKKNPFDDEEEDDLSDDEFYDRASKAQARKKKEVVQKVETSDSLLDQKAALTTEIENLREAITAEEKTSSLPQEAEAGETEVETVDPLDQFMTQVSSTIMKDKASHLQKDLDSVSKELERVERLLKIADPTGEGLKKWELKKSAEGKQEAVASAMTRETDRIFPSKEDAQELASAIADASAVADVADIGLQGGTLDTGELKNSDESVNPIAVSEEDPTAVLPGLEPPVRLGAPMPAASEEIVAEVSEKVHEEATNFITYKERKKDIGGGPLVSGVVVVLEGDGQKPKTDEEGGVSIVDLHVADSVALLLRQKRGLTAEDSDVSQNTEQASVEEKQPSKQSSKKRKKQGPAKQALSTDIDSSEDWVPPAGQTGDGRTALNDKYGY